MSSSAKALRSLGALGEGERPIGGGAVADDVVNTFSLPMRLVLDE